MQRHEEKEIDMTRSEILQIAKPILFNSEMVRAILDGRKTETRRIIKVNFREGEYGYNIVRNAHTGEFCYLEVYDEWESEVRRIGSPYPIGSYMYVRETWAKQQGLYWHKADLKLDDNGRAYGCVPPDKWRPSIHMPKDAARIFLRVTNVKVERLQEITEDGAKAEGIYEEWAMDWWRPTYDDPDSGGYPRYRDVFAYELWDSTIKPKDRDKYGWAANPWVFVIQFEKMDVE